MASSFHKSTQVAKVDYIRAHPELLELGDRHLVMKLREAGLVSPTTYWRDVRPGYLRKEALTAPPESKGAGR
jgi:hypothetical protein